MFNFIRLFNTARRLQKFYNNLPNLSYLVTEDKDIRDLAVGRWEMYKAVNVPAFKIGLTTDLESILRMITFTTVTSMKGMSIHGVLIAEGCLIHTNLMIHICEQAAKQKVLITPEYISDAVKTKEFINLLR